MFCICLIINNLPPPPIRTSAKLLGDGWTEKMFKWYQVTIEQENKLGCFDQDYLEWAHANGFYAESACSYNLTPDHIEDYLSDYNYLKVWPLNSWTRIWVNDKLTLKYMLANTEFDKFMPEYYYYSTPQGLKSLIDNPYKEASNENFIRLLTEKESFACKPCNGTTAIGFVKLSYKNGEFFQNKEIVSKEKIVDFVHKHPNYVFTEYLKPSKEFAQYSKLIHTLRIVTLNANGIARIAGGYLRLPTAETGEANYLVLNDNGTEKYNFLVNIDLDKGVYDGGKRIFINRTESCIKHPDSGEIIKGIISNYEALKETILSIANRFNTLEWLGFDIGVTDKGFKCMEINTHPGIKYMQILRPFLIDDFLKEYFSRKIWEVDKLTDVEKQVRFKIVR